MLFSCTTLKSLFIMRLRGVFLRVKYNNNSLRFLKEVNILIQVVVLFMN